MERRIVCAACRNVDGRTIVGPRHFDFTMWAQICGMSLDAFAEMISKPHDMPDQVVGWNTADEGFIDQHGKFLTREEAWVIAEANGQIIRDKDWCRGSLHSEHLY